MKITRQLRIGFKDEFTPAKLLTVAHYFGISNANACLFCLNWQYDVNGIPFRNQAEMTAPSSNFLFLHFTKEQLTRAEDIARGYGISLLQLAKRAIKDTAESIEDKTFEPYHPKVLAYFRGGNV